VRIYNEIECITLTLKGEEDEESEIIRFLRRLGYVIEKAEMVVGAYMRNMPAQYVHLMTRHEFLRRE
jgi:hypothetical protein